MRYLQPIWDLDSFPRKVNACTATDLISQLIYSYPIAV